jgi:hypothetical protein
MSSVMTGALPSLTPAVALSWLFSVRFTSLVMRREGLRHDAVKDNDIKVSRLHELDQVVN